MSGIVRRSGQPEPERSDPLAIQVADAQQKIGEALVRAGLKNDPVRYVFDAISHIIAVLPAHAQRIEAARQPVQDRALHDAVVTGVRDCAMDIIRHNTLRTALIGTGVALAWTAAVAGGVWWYCESHLAADVSALNTQLTGSEAAGLQELLKNNPGLAQYSRVRCSSQGGRMACAVGIWTEPAPALASQPAPQ